MRYLSVCSGIEAASCAWHWLGWTPAGFAEIEDFPSAVLAHHYPGVKNYGDFTTIARSAELTAEIGPVDVLVGGTPCQSFSVAGLRGGLSDERGNLALEFFRLAEAVRPRWILWENVPGVLSSGDGRDFGAILGAMAYLGYGYAWRVLDAQFFGVPQRRRRVFLVGHSGGSCDGPATVLFEPEGVRRDPPQKRKAGKSAAAAAGAGATERGEREPGDIAGTFVPAVSCAVTSKWHKGTGGPAGDECQNLVSQPQPGDPCHPLAAGAHPPAVAMAVGVRRLTPRECERLQGFPDDWTLIEVTPGKLAADGPRYKALGNSMAVPVMYWIGRRIAQVDREGPYRGPPPADE